LFDILTQHTVLKKRFPLNPESFFHTFCGFELGVFQLDAIVNIAENGSQSDTISGFFHQ